MVNHLQFGATVSLPAVAVNVCNPHFSILFCLNPKNISLGFQNVVTIDSLRESHPFLDVVDHNRRPKDSVSVLGSDFNNPEAYFMLILSSIYCTIS